MKRISPQLCGLALVTAMVLTAHAAEKEITYTLPKDGRVSLAVYNANGQMVRTLRNAERQKAGPQTVTWDGLDRLGQAVPPGDYQWKLLLNQGMKAEYLLSLGTSVGIDFWTAQHGGPSAVHALPGGDVLVGASTEGAPMIVRLNPATSRTPWVNDIWAGGGVADIAVLDEIFYILNGSGKVQKFNLKTGGQLPGEIRPDLPGPELGPIESTKETQKLPFAAKLGAFRIRGKVDFPAGGGEVKLVAGGKSDLIASKKGGESGFGAPGQDGPQSHMGEYDATKVKEITFQTGAMMDKWSAPSVRIFGVADQLSGGDGVLAASYPAIDQVAWLDPACKILASAEVKSPRALAVVDAQTLLVISGKDVVEIKREGAPKVIITGLVAPSRVAADPATGQIFVVEAGNLQQIKRFSRDGKLEATFGREGGRKPGKYVPEDFSAVSDISADGQGGFWITEALSAPRRTAHFDIDGKLLGEWYGGQQFYTWAAPDPEDTNILWMDSQWGWIMKVEVDWDKRTWKVLSTYVWGDNYSPELVNRFKMAQQHHVKRLDLDKDGQKETYLVSGVGLQKVDEEKGRLRMVSTIGMIATNRAWEWDKFPLEKQPKPWLDAIALKGEDPAQVFKQYRGFSWADANGDFEFQPEEIRVVKNGSVEGKGGFYLTEDLSVIKSAGWGGSGGNGKPNWLRFPVQGFTPTGSPIWDWNKFEPFPINVTMNPRDILFDPSGNVYQILTGGGDGYSPLDTMAMGHGFGWPVNQTLGVEICKWNPQGELLWSVGSLAGIGSSPGQLFHPVSFAGLVNETIGVCDKVILPLSFWTDDGLYAGSLFDRRAEDGLPKRVYSWWKAGTDDFNPETGRAMFQYDMILGGSLIKRPNGDVIFIGSGWNNCPAYRVTGWDEFERQEGKVTISAPAVAAAQTGTGLNAEFFTNAKREGAPAFSVKSPRIWFEPARARKTGNTQMIWPAASTAAKEAIDPLARTEVAEESLEDLEKPKTAPTPAPDGRLWATWSGQLEPRFSEAYTFAIYRQDGSSKLWIDGQLVAETDPKANKANSKPIPLKAGQKYDLRMEWTGKRGDELHLNWQSLSQPVEHIPLSALYPKNDPPKNSAP